MKKIKKLIAPAALSLLLALGLAIFVPGFVNSATKTENNMILTYTADGPKNGPYTMTIEAQQNKQAVAINIPITQQSLTITGLMNLIDSSQQAGNPLLYSDDSGVTAYPITYTTTVISGIPIVIFEENGEKLYYDMSQTSPVSWATPEHLFHAGLSDTKYDASSTLTVSFLSDFDLSEATIEPRSASLTGNTLSATGFDFDAHATDSNDPQSIKFTISNVKLADKSDYSQQDDNINTIDESSSNVSNSSGENAKFPQDTVPVGPEYTYTLNYDANGGENAPASQSEGPIPDETKDFVIAETVPTRDNYTFQGWAEGADAPDTIYRPGDTITLESSEPERTLYALWEENEITITYQASEGGSVSLEGETIKIVTGQPEGSTAAPSEGYYFVNWTDEEGMVVSTDPTFIPEENREATYTANFKAIPEEITPDTAIDVIDPSNNNVITTGNTNPKTSLGVNIAVFAFIFFLSTFGLVLSAIARIKR